MGYELTDEEIKKIVKGWSVEHYGAEPYWWLVAYKDIAKAAQAKLQSYYRDMAPEKLREKITEIVESYDSTQPIDCYPDSPNVNCPVCNTVDQILSLVMGYFVEKKEVE